MTSNFWRFIFVAIFLSSCVQANSQLGTNNCISRQTCHECIQTELCAWCMQPDLTERRCFYAPGTDASKFCEEKYVFYPSNVFSIVQNRNLSSEMQSESSGLQSTRFNANDGKQEAVQIAPQEVNVKVRINQAQRIRFSFSQAEDYPVDLYYLMDLSKSMEDDKKKLSDLGELLVKEMSSLTSKFRLGFGSFVDKVVMPYVSVVPQMLLQPCKACAAPYGYKHIMRLSQDTSLFADLVRNASVSGNLDAPEGGFDAIMQAIVCKDEIGWRDKARRLLVFSTDASFHYAGDGKLGGIVKPNDGMCHLDSSGLYTHSSLQDYPSISQINQKVKQNAINIIWAITQGEMSIYSRLCSHIEGSSAGELSNDSSNIVELIKNQYNQIRSTVEIRDTISSDAVKIKYLSQCLNGNKNIQPIETTKCDKLKKGDKVEFIADITVTHCPNNRSEWNQTFTIYPVGINEALRINLEMICECDCERPEDDSYKENSSKCNNNGTYKCGVCDCNPGSFGKKCECNNTANDHYKNFQNCRRDNSSLVDCSGRGECTCGVCECYPPSGENLKIWGDYCECDNFSCDRRDNKYCSGNGECGCDGFCKCKSGWIGKACECKSSNDTCIQPGTNLECSGKGNCVCGQCECLIENGVRYSGSYCQKCATCKDRCEELTPCVMCQLENIGNVTIKECPANCTEIPIEYVDAIDKTLVMEDEIVCKYKGEDDCNYLFMYYYNDTKLVIEAQKQKECPPKIYLLGIVMAVIAGIVMMGLTILFIWKLLTTIHDRREFAKFEKERMMAKWDTGENPIYKQATSTFKNPTYAGKS
ncbi:integrin beta-PS-like [Leptopilina boulardi]|uniref:integrin beta-PS-like n=1 Tax=Leptopilina boulardi TaxID=63433 RepID=UPI0021F54126|nr:integrin beta-PS-like [Leptopilina boulardi]XP_051176247.1 integrin beta-PS-like [Leptopilina boulardi]